MFYKSPEYVKTKTMLASSTVRNDDEAFYEYVLGAMVLFMRTGLEYHKAFESAIFNTIIVMNEFELPDEKTFVTEERNAVTRFLRVMYQHTETEERKDKILNLLLEFK